MSRQKKKNCLPSNWTRLSYTRIIHASTFWSITSLGKTWFSSRKTKLCGHGEGNTPVVVKKALCTPNPPDQLLSRDHTVLVCRTTCPRKRLFLKRYLKGHTWGPGWFRWQWGVRAMRTLPSSSSSWPRLRSDCLQPVTSSPADSLTRARSKTSLHTNTHQTDTVWLLHRSEPGQSLFWCKAFWEFCLPLLFFFILFFFHLIALFTFPGWLKAFPQRWLMSWTGREQDYETLWPAPRKDK